MDGTRAQFSIHLEILHAMMKGIALSIVILLTISLLQFVHNVLTTDWLAVAIQHQGVMQTIASAIVMPLLLLLWAGFGFVVITVVSLPQFMFLAMPLAHMMSVGLERDAKRSWAFYMLAGLFIGGGPWWLFLNSVNVNKWDWSSTFLVVTPGTVVGVLAGAALKYQLQKLAVTSNKRTTAGQSG